MNDFSAYELEPSVLFVGENVHFVSFASDSSVFTASTLEPQNYLKIYNLISSAGSVDNESSKAIGKTLTLSPRSSNEYKISGEPTKLTTETTSQLGFCSTSQGDVFFVNKLLEETSEARGVMTHIWKNVHANMASSNTFDQKFTSLVSFGDNNTIALMQTDDYSKVQRVKNPSGSVPFCCRFSSANCILTGDLLGHNVLFDLREQSTPLKFAPPQSANKTRHFSKNMVSGVTCLDVKPDQPDVVACGMENGEVYMWDLRNVSSPVSYFEGHERSLWDIKFHPSNCALLYTASENGELWQWGSSQSKSTTDFLSRSQLNMSSASTNQNARNGPSNHDVWNSSTNEICVDSLLPENNVFGVLSLSVMNSNLVCAVRNQSVFVFSGISF